MPAPSGKAAGPVEVVDRTPVTWAGDVSTALQAGRKSEPAPATLRIYEGNAEGKEFHFQ